MTASSKAIAAFGYGVCCLLWLGAAPAQPPGTPLPEGIRGGSELVPERGVEVRTYRFEETGEDLPYSVFVSSKIKPGSKAPLIVALRGYTGTTLTFVRGTTVDLAEAGGYILVGPIGYNNRAGFGVEARPRPGRPPAQAPGAAPAPPLIGGSAATDPALVTAYSEKDVMNVLERVRREFNIDDRRIYLMGHSQGGGGARHLAEKYPDIWAGVALLAPALFGVEPTADSNIVHLPVLIAVGDQDSLLPSARTYGEQLKALNADVEYREFAGLDHGTIILGSQPTVFAFFAKHVKNRSGAH
ncbi:MAG TPA: alpha/beta fold hydrolase [Gammaproteobacteria bacterium]|nr:alpha/beta fold hydrolase [Gammaproteobacteria bacterium]